MLENFLYSINVTIPIFAVMVLGWWLRQREMFNDNFVEIANKFNFSVTLPFLVFRDIAAVDIRAVFDLKYVLFCAISSSVCFWGIWGLARFFIKDKTLIGAFVQAAFRSSAAVMGLAFISNLYGPSAMGPLMIIGAVPLYNIYSVIVLTFEAEGGREDSQKIKEAAVNIVKNPIIISIALGLAVSLLRLEFPVVVNKTIGYVAQVATPLALVTLGAGFEGRKALAKMKPTLWAAFIKLIAQATIFIPVAIWIGFTGEKLIGIMVMLAAPATPSCYIMAKNMKNDGILTASIVVSTTLLAAFTLTGWIFILRSLGFI
ncbi:MAG: AEC family transporter [Lachnospiraceae bacterium]|nr:AEC family transporter [Lachnospiraceae bacterium]